MCRRKLLRSRPNRRGPETVYTVVYSYLDDDGMAALYHDCCQASSPLAASIALARKVPTVPTDCFVIEGEHYGYGRATPPHRRGDLTP